MTAGSPTATCATRAEALGQTLPPLLAEAEMLASTVMLGEHGRRRAGMGDEFWQYRPAHAGDAARSIDWRRSARVDAHFVREREWQAAQSVTLWVDPSKSMGFTGAKGREAKGDRARLLALALAVLLLRGGERVGLAGLAPPRAGRAQIVRLAARLAGRDGGCRLRRARSRRAWSAMAARCSCRISWAIWPGLNRRLARASDRGVQGCAGAGAGPGGRGISRLTAARSLNRWAASVSHETQKAGELRDRYLARLAERKDRLTALARAVGWHFTTHHTGQPAQSALLWLYRALEGGR